MRLKPPSILLANWLAGLYICTSVYVLWIYYRALQYQPIASNLPWEVVLTQSLIVLFQVFGLGYCLFFFTRKKQDEVRILMVVLCVVQLVALFMTPFVIAAALWPRL